MSIIVPIFVLGLVVGIYFFPTIVGYSRKVKNADSVMIINLLAGWTLIGWIIAMAMAVRDEVKK